jgi:flagellar biosynthetic protein FlhB
MTNFKINLQLFAGDKTEKATPRRREEARKKGQVVKSNEIITVIVLTLTLLVLKYWLFYMANDFQSFFIYMFTFIETDFTLDQAQLIIVQVILVTVKMAGPIVLTALVAGYTSNVMQIGFLFTSKPLKIDLNRLNPINGMKRIFSKRALAELVKTILKTCLVGFVAFYFLFKQLPRLAVLMDSPIDVSLYTIGEVTFTTGWRILAVLLLIAIADYAYQVYEYEQSLKMSKQEIKEEYKTIEGDPHLKSEMKARQRQLATRRMMQEIPQATVVITNPTHLAIALKYKDEMQVPVVVAKGQDFLAQKIKQLASENNVVIVENKNLARLLYKEVEIGRPIPVELYKAIAEVLAYVYKIKGSF